MSNLPTDKYAIFMVNTEMMTQEQYKDLANANFIVFEGTETDRQANPEDFSDSLDKSFRDHEQFLEEVKQQNKDIDHRMEMGEEGV